MRVTSFRSWECSSGHAVDVGAAVGGQVGHAHGVASVDGHVLDGVLVDALGLELVLELRVDLLDDLKVTRQQLADQAGRQTSRASGSRVWQV